MPGLSAPFSGCKNATTARFWSRASAGAAPPGCLPPWRPSMASSTANALPSIPCCAPWWRYGSPSSTGAVSASTSMPWPSSSGPAPARRWKPWPSGAKARCSTSGSGPCSTTQRRWQGWMEWAMNRLPVSSHGSMTTPWWSWPASSPSRTCRPNSMRP